MNLVLRTAGDPLALAEGARRVVHEIDAALPVAGLTTLDRVVGDSVSRSRLLTFLVGLFGLLALALAAVGTYGVLSYGVEQRRHEMGVRLALGAARSSILGLVLTQGMRPVVGGLIAGVALAIALRRVLASQLYGVAPTDPLTFGVVVLVLLAVALAACLVPGRRATRVDPLVALRYE
jgi:ABC-type antimicrobial peptide transport system permease subunit